MEQPVWQPLTLNQVRPQAAGLIPIEYPRRLLDRASLRERAERRIMTAYSYFSFYRLNMGDPGNHKSEIRDYSAGGYVLRRGWTFAGPLALALFLMLFAASCGGSSGTSSPDRPVANAGGPYFTNVGQAITLNGTGSTAPSGQALTYSWNFGDGTTGTGASPTHTYTISGDFTVALTVTDTGGATNMTTVAVQVFSAPVANAGGPYTGTVGQSITFNGAASTPPPGESLAYSWDFGDGSTAGSGVAPAHTYSSAGTFHVTLSVTDDTGGKDSNTTSATISSTGMAVPAGSVTLVAVTSAPPGVQRFAFVASSAGGSGVTLSTKAVEVATGLLAPTANSTLSLGNQFTLSGMTLDPTSKFLYLYGGTTILNFVVDPVSGALMQQDSTIANGNVQGGGLLAFTPDGGFAFLASSDANKSNSTGADIVTVYSVDSTAGTLNAIGTSSSQVQSPKASALDTQGKYLYVLGSKAGVTDGPSQIGGYSINPQTGALRPLPGSPFSVGSQVSPVAMAVDPAGRFVYAAGGSATTEGASLSAFSIDAATGLLTELSSSPIAAGGGSSSPINFSLDPSGTFAYLLTATAESDAEIQQSIQVFSVNAATGAPSLIRTQVMGTSALNATSSIGTVAISPSIAMTPGGAAEAGANSSVGNASAKYLYITNPADGSVSIFSIDRATGLLNSVSPTNTSRNQ
jgi:PKD repeat protein